MPRKASSDKILKDLQTVVEDAEALLQATSAQTGDKIDSIRSRAKASLSQARARLSMVEEEAIEQVREAAQSADDYVRANPWQAVGAAAGVALLLGLLISRR
jgi:ElaB/YqjD/DUF883 family membrane-anchored ribosome-binding protein